MPLRELLEPLLAVPQVLALKVRYHDWKATLDGNDIHVFAEAWPELEEMTFNLLRYGGPYPSPVALVHLARYCPKLKSLCLPLDIEVPLGILEGKLVSDHRLRSLVVRVRRWEVGAAPAKELARMVDVLFPNLMPARCFIRWKSLDTVPECVSLKGVRDELQALRKQRREGIESDAGAMIER